MRVVNYLYGDVVGDCFYYIFVDFDCFFLGVNEFKYVFNEFQFFVDLCFFNFG